MCGLLFGTNDKIESWRQAANASPSPATQFEIDPAALFAAQRNERNGGPRWIGHVHSHPSGTVDPSARDAAMADADGRFWLIVTGNKAACWVARSGGAHHDRFDSVAIDILDPLASRDSVGQSGRR